MELTHISIRSARGFRVGTDLELRTPKWTVLIGPNGSGKTTLLEILACVMEVPARRKITVPYPKGVRVTEAEHVVLRYTRIRGDSDFDGELAEMLGASPSYVELSIRVHSNRIDLERVTTPTDAYRMASREGELTALVNERDLAQKRLNDVTQQLQNAVRTPPHRANKPHRVHASVPALQQMVRELEASLTSLNERVKRERQDLVLWENEKSGSKTETVEAVFVGLIEVCVPNRYLYIPFGSIFPDQTPAMLAAAIASKQGRDETLHREITTGLTSLLEVRSEAYRDGAKDVLFVGGSEPANLSSGSQISLRYFAHSFSSPMPLLVLWDEPENGLHATRRHRLMAMAFADKKKYIVATHAPEFVPHEQSFCAAYRASSTFDEVRSATNLALDVIASRGSAFNTLEDLGINPSAVLFTANCVVWVEGPSDVIFWRWALRVHPDTSSMIDGFDYTILAYGGSTILHLGLDDEPEGELVDLFAVCRYAILVVDSDFESEGAAQHQHKGLKPAARQLFEAAQVVNSSRPDAACVIWTPGRELENHYPEQIVRDYVAQTQKPRAGTNVENLSISKFGRYHEEIKAAVEADKCFKVYDGRSIPMGKSRWGADGKVALARYAVSHSEMKLAALRWGMEHVVADVARWLRAHRRL